jgi:hypothetical protein
MFPPPFIFSADIRALKPSVTLREFGLDEGAFEGAAFDSFGLAEATRLVVATLPLSACCPRRLTAVFLVEGAGRFST